MNIYVGNISFQMTEGDLRNAFAAYGNVTNVKIVKDKVTGKSRGFGFVEMENDDEGRQAVEALNGAQVGGRNLKVNEAQPREEQPRHQSSRPFNKFRG